MAKISIHLVTWNAEKYIQECLDSVFKQTDKDFFLLIIDNGSADKTLQIIEENFLPVYKDKIRLIKNKTNLGFAWAHNQAILWTSSDYVLMLNQDVILDKQYLAQIGDFLAKNKKVGSVTGKILRWDFVSQGDWNKSEKTDIIDSLGLKIFKNHRFVEIAAGEIDKQQFEEPKTIFGVSGTCAVYRRSALEDVRYKDEFLDNDFFSYKEDVDLAYRLQWRGWQSFYYPPALAYHDRTAKGQENISALGVIKQRKNKSKFINYHSFKNHLFVLDKNLSQKNFYRYFLNIFFYEIKKNLYCLIFERSTLRAWQEFWQKRKLMADKRKFIMTNRLAKDETLRQWFN